MPVLDLRLALDTARRAVRAASTASLRHVRKRAVEDRTRGKPLRLNVLTGASTGPELDQVMALFDSIAFRFPYNGHAVMRQCINEGSAEYQDMRRAPHEALGCQPALE